VKRALAMLLAVPLWAAPVTVKVKKGGATLVVPLERYVAGVLAGESSVFESAEALKAMAVAARTYAVRLRGRHAAEGYDFCITTHCQRVELDSIPKRLEAAAADTAGELLWFAGKPAFACYTRDCGGRSEDAGAVWPDLAAPYLMSRDDSYCARAGASAWRFKAEPLELAEALRKSRLRTPRAIERVSIEQRTASGRARTLVLTGGGEPVRISAGSFRFAVGRGLGWNTLPSDRYEVRGLAFEGRGSGHGVGLCQRGADQMGREGHSYREILAFYYPTTGVGLTGRGLPWQRLGGESIALFTMRPDLDAPVLGLAERALAGAARKLAVPPPVGIELRIYPDLETFRNVTGEPGWVAARTEGRRVHLQPAAALRSRGILDQTLRHEMLHVVVENQAVPGLPVWFREGLVGYLERAAAGQGPTHPPADLDLRQRDDPDRARRAQAAAARAAGSLVNRYGLAAVLGWLKTGLPTEVRNSSASQPPLKSR
jgi:stage II sporulation protein D